MGRYWPNSEELERRIWRAHIVARYHEDVTVMDYLRETS